MSQITNIESSLTDFGLDLQAADEDCIDLHEVNPEDWRVICEAVRRRIPVDYTTLFDRQSVDLFLIKSSAQSSIEEMLAEDELSRRIGHSEPIIPEAHFTGGLMGDIVDQSSFLDEGDGLNFDLNEP